MSKYTTEVRYICETAAGLTESAGYNDVNAIIEKAAPLIFNFDFPIFDEVYRPILEKKILKHFYTREIAFETVGLWKLMLDTRLNEIMPLYNQLYKSQLLEFNPLYDTDMWRTHTLNRDETVNETDKQNTSAKANGTADNETKSTLENNTSINSSNSDATNNTRTDKYSDTPQGALTNLTNDAYLTNARIISDAGNAQHEINTTQKDNSTGTTSVKNTSEDEQTSQAERDAQRSLNSIDEYTEHVSGKNGGVTYSAMLKEFRETFLNIDVQIISELSDLFFNLW